MQDKHEDYFRFVALKGANVLRVCFVTITIMAPLFYLQTNNKYESNLNLRNDE